MKDISDRNNMVRIQYSTHERVPSSMTIDPLIYELMSYEVQDVKKWFQRQASDLRAALIAEAEKLESEGKLVKYDKNGNKIQMTTEDYIRGKVSAQVRRQALLRIAKEELKEKLKLSEES